MFSPGNCKTVARHNRMSYTEDYMTPCRSFENMNKMRMQKRLVNASVLKYLRLNNPRFENSPTRMTRQFTQIAGFNNNMEIDSHYTEIEVLSLYATTRASSRETKEILDQTKTIADEAGGQSTPREATSKRKVQISASPNRFYDSTDKSEESVTVSEVYKSAHPTVRQLIRKLSDKSLEKRPKSAHPTMRQVVRKLSDKMIKAERPSRIAKPSEPSRSPSPTVRQVVRKISESVPNRPHSAHPTVRHVVKSLIKKVSRKNIKEPNQNESADHSINESAGTFNVKSEQSSTSLGVISVKVTERPQTAIPLARQTTSKDSIKSDTIDLISEIPSNATCGKLSNMSVQPPPRLPPPVRQRSILKRPSLLKQKTIEPSKTASETVKKPVESVYKRRFSSSKRPKQENCSAQVQNSELSTISVYPVYTQTNPEEIDESNRTLTFNNQAQTSTKILISRELQTDYKKKRDIGMIYAPKKQCNHTNTPTAENVAERSTQMYEHITYSDLVCIDWVNKYLFKANVNPFNLIMDERIIQPSETVCVSNDSCNEDMIL